MSKPTSQCRSQHVGRSARRAHTVGFAGGGIALLLKAFTQTSLGPGSNVGIFIVAAIFIPMGLAIWIPWLVRFVRARRTSPAGDGDRLA